MELVEGELELLGEYAVGAYTYAEPSAELLLLVVSALLEVGEYAVGA